MCLNVVIYVFSSARFIFYRLCNDPHYSTIPPPPIKKIISPVTPSSLLMKILKLFKIMFRICQDTRFGSWFSSVVHCRGSHPFSVPKQTKSISAHTVECTVPPLKLTAINTSFLPKETTRSWSCLSCLLGGAHLLTCLHESKLTWQTLTCLHALTFMHADFLTGVHVHM